ncbi:MAG: hypothetical protein IIA62_00190 [Nitrospinae bacterium]|nr:hypothetical protein [Nitrospinota bacterium]
MEPRHTHREGPAWNAGTEEGSPNYRRSFRKDCALPPNPARVIASRMRFKLKKFKILFNGHAHIDFVIHCQSFFGRLGSHIGYMSLCYEDI